ncbi:MAG: hypothetical protein H6718_05830 [Polyangiaceae bacterium]|nr:hypothetical protein [Myxococcales bacterium]MCB9584895.1 hypothetical protein [Polyangiaceae bacterium]MCB9607532.1 hypothetical protein [Polyangiaceae bacterium]
MAAFGDFPNLASNMRVYRKGARRRKFDPVVAAAELPSGDSLSFYLESDDGDFIRNFYCSSDRQFSLRGTWAAHDSPETVRAIWLRWCRENALALRIDEAHLHPESDRGLILRDRNRRSWLPHSRRISASVPAEIEEVYWWSAFSTELVKQLGRARFLSAPAASVEELKDGSMLVCALEDPDRLFEPEGVEARARIRSHLCESVALDQERERLRRRASLLAPAETRWDPLVEELLTAVIARNYPRHMALRLFSRLRNFRPPPIVEQGPLDELEAPSRAADERISDYVRWSESFREFMLRQCKRNTKSPLARAVRFGEPEVLPRFEAYNWVYPFGRQAVFVNPRLEVQLGAYLGCLIVDQFRGEWAPGLTTDDTAVVVGGRAWYPFLRARNYLVGRTRAQLLRYSLYYFYRTIETSLAEAN